MSKYAELYESLVKGGDTEAMACAVVDDLVREDCRKAARPFYAGWFLARDMGTGKECYAQVKGNDVRMISTDLKVPGCVSIDFAKQSMASVRREGKLVTVADQTAAWEYRWGQ